MILDAQLQFSADQALTTTAASTNVLDMLADRNLGLGSVPLAVLIVVKVATDGTTGDETYSAQLQTDDNAAFSSATSIGGAITIARGAAAGTKYAVPLPIGTDVERYLRLNYTLGGTTPTATLDAFLVPVNSIPSEAYYADAMTIA
jgi:hypothetical protein